MATLRELKGRIGSVASSEKITGAMKMISSAKMHKAEGALGRLLPYRNQIQTVIGHLLSADAQFTSPLLEAREVKRVALVVLGSDDGLCGAFNMQVFKRLLEYIRVAKEKYGTSLEITVIPIGKKMVKAVAKLADSGISLEQCNLNTRSSSVEVRDFTDDLKGRFVNKEFDRVDILYTHFCSVSRQTVEVNSLLPVSMDNLLAHSGASKPDANKPCLFEPDAQSIFRSVLPLFILSVMQEIVTENVASEQAARVMAMQSANDNAKTLLEELQLEYNKLRQQSITTELLDIIGGQSNKD